MALTAKKEAATKLTMADNILLNMDYSIPKDTSPKCDKAYESCYKVAVANPA